MNFSGSSINSSSPLESGVQRSLEGYSPWGHKELDTTEYAHIAIRINLDNKYGNKNDNQFGQIELDHENGPMGVVQLFVLVKSKPLSYFIFFPLRKFPFLTREI